MVGVSEHMPETEAVRLAAISAEIREYLTAETDVTRPGFHATALTHRLAHLLTPPDGPLAVTYQSPNGTSLTRCCCDRTTARLVVCPVHGEPITTPEQGAS